MIRAQAPILIFCEHAPHAVSGWARGVRRDLIHERGFISGMGSERDGSKGCDGALFPIGNDFLEILENIFDL